MMRCSSGARVIIDAGFVMVKGLRGGLTCRSKIRWSMWSRLLCDFVLGRWNEYS